MKTEVKRHLLGAILFLSATCLLQGCSRVEPVTNLLKEVNIGYIVYDGRDESQPVIIGLDHDSLITQPLDIPMTCPTWSPYYRQLAYSDDGDVYIYDIDRMTEEIINTDFLELSAPTWSPNGIYLAFSAQDSPDLGGLDIWLLDLSTHDLELVVKCSESSFLTPSCGSPEWLSDGRLGYVRHTGFGPNVTPLSNIEIFNPESYETEIIATQLPIYKGWAPFGVIEQFHYAHYSALAWSPDDGRVAFSGGSRHTGDRNIYVLDVSSKEVSSVLPSETMADTPVWLDDTHLIFRSVTRPDLWEEGTHTEAYNIAVVNVDNGKVTQLTDFAPIFGAGHNPVISCPFWIPREIGKCIEP
jgi:Tol biopolymer transport system component